jgi:hypothetical protein
MGGKGSGGRRLGSGRKQQSDLDRAISGDAGHRGVVLQHPSSTAIAPIEVFDPPKTLRGRPLQVWGELAPAAFEARTLTRATELAFVILCRNVALERRMASAKHGAGGTNHRGMIQRVDAELTKFCLSPFGKPMHAAQPAAAASPLDRFTRKKAGA